jgi:hypothetical protein
MENRESCSFRSGAIRAALFYVCGVLITCLFHFAIGWENKYAPPPAILIATAIVLIGVLWATLNLTSLAAIKTRAKVLGELSVHAIVILVSCGLVFQFVASTRL